MPCGFFFPVVFGLLSIGDFDGKGPSIQYFYVLVQYSLLLLFDQVFDRFFVRT